MTEEQLKSMGYVKLPNGEFAKPRARKFSDEQLTAAYGETGSIWKTAEKLGVCGQSVQERLIKLKIDRKHPPLSASEKEQIKSFYLSGFKKGDGSLKAFAASIGRTVPLVSRCAKELGLSAPSRGMSKSVRGAMAERQRLNIAKNGHPRGFLGGKHSDEAKAAIAKKSEVAFANLSAEQKVERSRKILATKYERFGSVAGPIARGSWKAGWREIAGRKIFARSRWEANYARFLQWQKEHGEIIEWEHEPTTFWFDEIKRGCVSYLPDFRVTTWDGAEEYHEVKGWMDRASKTKIRRMAKYFPTVRLTVIDSARYRALSKTCAKIVKGWE